MPSTRIALFLALTALAANGDIVASFANAGPVDSGTFRTAANTLGNDTITLAYSIDGTGAVSLDASTTNTNATFVNLVNQFDKPGGTAGSTTNSGFFNTAFSLKIVPLRVGSTTPRLSITTLNGGGLAVEGQNSNRVDGRTLDPSAAQTLQFELTAPAGMDLLLKNWSWVDGSGGDMRFSTGESTQGFVNLSASGTRVFDTNTDPEGGALLIGNTGILTFGETPDSTSGAGLGGFTFDILGSPVNEVTGVDVDFSHTYTGPAGENPQNTGAITLAFAVDSLGFVTLDASCADADALPYINGFDGPVGKVADISMRGKNFTIVLSNSGSGALRIDNTGSGLAIQGGTAQLIDNNNEQLTATVTAAAAQFNLQGIGFAQTAGSPQMNVAGMNSTLYGASGLLDVTAQEIIGTFTIGSSANSIGQGFVLSGLRFDLVPVPPPSGFRSFDNSSGDNLWTTATNWNPDDLPVDPDNALIDGYNVVVNSPVTTGPANLEIIDGSLTVSGSGALTMKSMNIGRTLEKNVRLVIHGSGVSFGQSTSSAADDFAVGSAATVETKPDALGCEPLELGPARLVLAIGSQWILDGTNAAGPYTPGDRFVLANFGSFSGSTGGVRTRNFDLPTDRRLDLVHTPTSLYYEVVAQTAASGPNIIIINVDDMAGGQHFNFEGRSSITPTMDSLVSTGLRFTSAFCTSPVCGPSRYSLMTSRWPSRNTSAQFIARYPLNTLGRFGVADTELEPDGQNLGAWLRQAGYRTGMVGKGHFTDDDLNQTSAWAAKGLRSYAQNANPATDATTNAKMKHNHRVLCQRMRAFGFDYVNSYYKANLLELYNEALNVHNQEWITKGALDFIEENHDERFFLYMAPTINHGPVKSDLTKTLKADVRFTGEGYLPNEDYSFMPGRQTIINEVTAAGKDLISARETWLDYSIQAILNKLTQHGIRNDTLIIFTSDHGEKTLSGPLVWGKSSLYDLGMKVPLVINWPNGITSPGRVYNEIVSHVDLAPTLLQLAGASGLPTRPVDGVSLVPVFNGSNAAVREDLFAEVGYARAVRTKDRKYIALRYTPSVYNQVASGFLWPNFANGQTTEPRPYYVNNSSLGSLVANTEPTYFDDDQLYNLSTDPNENTNRYGQEPATTYDLKKRLANYIGGIPNRPFRQFGDSSREFSPAPAATPTSPAALNMQFLNPNSIQLNWSDAATNELGYVVRKTVNGGTPEIIAELPSGTTSTTAALNPGVEDIIIEVASYNSLGDAPAAVPIDLLEPESWRFRTFGDVDPSLSLPISQWSHDADGDGIVTLWEYAYGTHPRLASSVARSELRLGSVSGDSFLEYFVPRQRRRNVEITGSVSLGGLSSWQSGPPHCIVVEDGENHLLFRSLTPINEEPRQFIRAGITEP
ncbi:MAG: sulfatase-like hydrolase/transferase [Akkermansiaceae bacterium]